MLTRAQVREIDRRAIEEFGVPGVVLMENAGRGATEVLLSLGVKGPVVICCGKGNNGGDGFVIARHLDNHGIAVQVLLFAKPEELVGDAAINYRVIERSGLTIDIWPDSLQLQASLNSADWIVDALFGTGLSGLVREPFHHVITTINASGKPVLAVDIPSGLDCDCGQPLGVAIRAAHTVTFVGQKVGFARSDAREYLGMVHVADIGAPRRTLILGHEQHEKNIPAACDY
jgi:NAD(P)H-hydrate epimerase